MNPIQNIIYIHTHDMGRYISPYGFSISTPALMAFSKEATLFRNAFCCGPTCAPSRAGLLTGMTPHESGMIGLAHRGFKLTHPEHHLGAFLKRAGFHTALCGVQHEFNSSMGDLPYESVPPISEGHEHADKDKIRTEAAIAFLKKPHATPFFLSFGLFYPHRPYDSADYTKFNPDQITPPLPLPDLPSIRKDMADFHHTMSLADENIGAVLRTISEQGYDKNSLIIITTDHGIAFPGMKCHLTDHGIGVTLMMRYPGNPSAGKSLDALVSHLDVYPTICELLKLDPPSHLQGKSLVPLFEGKTDKIRDEIFSEVTFHAAYEPMRCIRTDRYKLIKRFGTDKRSLANCDASLSKETLLGIGWGEASLANIELYDLLLDPHESNNLLSSVQYQKIREGLEKRLHQWMKKTSDPLLNDQVSIPVGAKINTADSLDPADGPFEMNLTSLPVHHGAWN